MKVHFQIFGDILLFVGWLAPAYGKGEVNSTGSARGRVGDGRSQFLRDHFVGWLAPCSHLQPYSFFIHIAPQNTQKPVFLGRNPHFSFERERLFHLFIYLCTLDKNK